jgi:protein disulfide-isomerase A1
LASAPFAVTLDFRESFPASHESLSAAGSLEMMFMKQAARALALLFAVALVVRAAEFEEEDDVLVLTEGNFAEAVSGHDTLLVEFYAPWCGHCKKLAPEYSIAAKNLKELDPPIRLAKVDATAESKLAEQFAVRGFPTLKFFKGDVEAVKDYDGGRTAPEIEKWVVKKSGPAVKIVETAEELEELKEANDVVVFAVIDAEEGEARAMLEKLADADDLAVYVASTSADVTEDAAAVNKVVLYKKFDEGKVVYDGEFEKEALGEFVKENSLPLVIMFSQEKAPLIFGGEMTEHVLAFVDTSKDYVSGIEAALKTPAQANKGKLLHVIMPSTEKRIVDYFGLTDEDMPAVMLVNMGGSMKKFGFNYKADDLVAKIEDGLAEDLVAFEQSYFEGKLTPQLKSAEPEDDSDEAVKVIVGKQFQERVIDNEKDVLLEFYAPWCGHCKALAPKYEELAEKFADVDSIMIAKMDATANEIDHAGVDVRGFPTIIFFPAKDKQNPIVYEGSRDVDGFTDFLKTNAQKFELEGSEHGAEEEEASEEDEEDASEEGEEDASEEGEEDAAEEKKEGAEHEEL